jgi:hypothetical protein
MSDSLIPAGVTSQTLDDSDEPSRCRPLQITPISVEAAVESLAVPNACPLPQRRHGRFLVQPLPNSPAPSCVRAPSPASKFQQQPLSSPTPSSVSERRPSRIIGRFEVSELLPSVKPHIDSSATSSTASGDNTPQKPPLGCMQTQTFS